MKLCVIGTGYVGLVDATCFAETGNEVIGVDIDETKINNLKKGIIPIFEPGLDLLVNKHVKNGRLTFSTDIKKSVAEAQICFISVGTPPKADGSADLSYVRSAAETIGKSLNGYKIIVNKSTVPVGTAELVRDLIKKLTKHEFDVVSNPEFLKEGAAINDFMKPERIIIGTNSDRAYKLMEELYAPFVRTGAPLIRMDNVSAELTKYAANAMLATRISFMNEMANLAEKVGANVDLIRKGLGSDSRIGSKFLFPGVGYGGSCFPKDVKAIIQTGSEYGYELSLLKAVDDLNQRQKKVLVEKINKHFSNNIKGKIFAVWGLAFKPQTDDMREASSLVIINALLAQGAKVQASDPEALKETKKILGEKITYFEDNYQALNGADALIVVTEWNEYREPNFEKIKKSLKNPLIFDGRNIYSPQKMQELGFVYYSIGR